ncbi:MAG TPA: RNA polymerase sigma factor [Candidatus Dormibacteraeota bacterium]|nr:RNA polymerase sigma factor [Candidatus Dormibacteraeota bacterium]
MSDEQDALERAKAGDGLAFEEMLAPVLDPAFRLAMTMLNDRGAAEDAVQEAALNAWRKLGQFRTGSVLRPWFLAIVANECRSARRLRWWRVLKFPDLRADSAAPQDTWAERVDLDAALERLAPHHLLALSLYYHLDLPIEEVARVLGCSEGAARQRIHRALAAIRPGLVMGVDG